MLSESDASGAALRWLVVVASACSPGTTAGLGRIIRGDHRVTLVEEESRRGKAEAINRILDLTETPLVAFVNSDSRPAPGALAAVLEQLSRDHTVGAVSAMPVPQPGGRGLTSLLIDFMWGAHNSCSSTLNHMNIANHSCDELVAYRAAAIDRLPPGLVND
ncbi:MAG TPA: glycosyltransferase, partial [Nitrososphaerales archaeon]|nr:glycosyltransferase [Nitrososphaerales archaeon]